MNDYITKPIIECGLKEKIFQWLNKKTIQINLTTY